MNSTPNPFWPFADLAMQQLNAANAMGQATMDAMMGQTSPSSRSQAKSETAKSKSAKSDTPTGADRSRTSQRKGKTATAKPIRTTRAKTHREPVKVASVDNRTAEPSRRSPRARKPAGSWYRPPQKSPTEAWAAAFGMDDPKHPMAPWLASAQMAEHAAKFWNATLPLMPTAAKAAPTPSAIPSSAAMANPFSAMMSSPFMAAFAPTMGDTAFTWVDSWLDATQPNTAKPTTRRPAQTAKATTTPTRGHLNGHSTPCARDLPKAVRIVEPTTTDAEPSLAEATSRAMMTFFDPFGVLGGGALGGASSRQEAGSSAPSTVPARRTNGSAVANGHHAPTYAAPVSAAPNAAPTVAPQGPVPLLTAQYHPPASIQAGSSPWGFITIALAVPPAIGDGFTTAR